MDSYSSGSFGYSHCSAKRSVQLSWPFSKKPLDPAEQAKAVVIYRRLFTQPRKLATLRAEFDVAVHEGSVQGTTPELVETLRGHAGQISRLMSAYWESVVNGTEEWPTLQDRRGEELAAEMCRLFVEYVEKSVHWLDYFVMDPSWLNLTAVNYAANAAREAANEVRQARLQFEEMYELTRDHLSASSTPKSQSNSEEPGVGEDGTNAA